MIYYENIIYWILCGNNLLYCQLRNFMGTLWLDVQGYTGNLSCKCDSFWPSCHIFFKFGTYIGGSVWDLGWVYKLVGLDFWCDNHLFFRKKTDINGITFEGDIVYNLGICTSATPWSQTRLKIGLISHPVW